MLHPRTLGGLTSRALIYLADLAFSCTPPLSLSTTGIASSRITRSYATLYSLDWLLLSFTLLSSLPSNQQSSNREDSGGSHKMLMLDEINYNFQPVDVQCRPVAGPFSVRLPASTSSGMRVQPEGRDRTMSPGFPQMEHRLDSPEADAYRRSSSPHRYRWPLLVHHQAAVHSPGNLFLLPYSRQEVYQRGTGQCIVETRAHSSKAHNVSLPELADHDRDRIRYSSSVLSVHGYRPHHSPVVIHQHENLTPAENDFVLYPPKIPSPYEPEIERSWEIRSPQSSGRPQAPRPRRLPTPELENFEEVGFCDCRNCHVVEDICKQCGLEIDPFSR
ncbi:hypothetical protein IAQ61_008779, partial [Plenodomus lingam]